MKKPDKTIFITGGASGIGAATVIFFLKKSWNVCFIDSDESKSKALLKELGNPQELSYFYADVRDYENIVKAVECSVEKYGTIDALFSNAGIHLSADILSTSFEDWQKVIDTNLKGTFNTIKATLPILLNNTKSSIVLMGSDQSLIGKKHSFAYGATKGAIGQIAKSLALDYAQDNIRVNCVCPATIDTPLSAKVLQSYADTHYNGNIEKVMQLEASEFPLGRIGECNEVAQAVYFLVSDASSFITGTLLPVDGGYTAK